MLELRKDYSSIQEFLKDNVTHYHAKDLVMVKRLQKSSKVCDENLLELLIWWSSEKKAKGTLLEFLIKNKIFFEKAKSVLGGKIKAKKLEIDELIDDRGLDRILSQLQKSKQIGKSNQGDPKHQKKENLASDRQSSSDSQNTLIETQSISGVPKVGSRLGKCVLVTLIGKGSTCLVFEGFHETLKIKVAVKIFLSTCNFKDGETRKQFSLEARILAKLNHPYIVRVLDFEDGKFPYIILEYVEGESLAALIEKEGAIECRKAALIIYRCAIGLMVAHQSGIVHRDIKPANILISTSGEAKLTDLGLAHIKSNLGSKNDAASKSSGHFNGTPAYAAPEQAFDPNAGDFRSDIYSLGATFYHAITGKFPFEGESVYAVVMKHINETLAPPHTVCSNIPLEISECIQMMMEKKPEDRFQSIEDMLPELISFFLTAKPGPNSSRTNGEKNIKFRDSITGPITRIIFRSMKKMVDSSNQG